MIANKNNSKVILESSSIKLTEASGFVTSFVHFKHMVMADYNASNNNQSLLDWFKTHAFTIGERQFTIIWNMCQARKGDTLPLIMTIFCLL